MSTSAVLVSLASRLKAERERRNLTLDDLSVRTGLSHGYLSRLESGERQPAIATLLTLAQALGLRVGSLLGDDEQPSLAVYPPAPSPFTTNGLSIAACSGYPGSRELEALRIVISAERPEVPFARHPGEEWLHVLRGTVRLEHGSEVVSLHPGTSTHFDAAIPHRLSAPDGEAEALLVATTVRQGLPEAHH